MTARPGLLAGKHLLITGLATTDSLAFATAAGFKGSFTSSIWHLSSSSCRSERKRSSADSSVVT